MLIFFFNKSFGQTFSYFKNLTTVLYIFYILNMHINFRINQILLFDF